MNEEAFNTMYMLAQKEGYKKTPEEFKTLLSSNQEAFNTMYSIAQREGYKKTPEEFKTLLGVSGVEGEPVNFTEGSVEQQEQPAEPLEKPIVDKVNLNPYTVTTTSLAGRNIEKPKTKSAFEEALNKEMASIPYTVVTKEEVDVFKEAFSPVQGELTQTSEEPSQTSEPDLINKIDSEVVRVFPTLGQDPYFKRKIRLKMLQDGEFANKLSSNNLSDVNKFKLSQDILAEKYNLLSQKASQLEGQPTIENASTLADLNNTVAQYENLKSDYSEIAKAIKKQEELVVQRRGEYGKDLGIRTLKSINNFAVDMATSPAQLSSMLEDATGRGELYTISDKILDWTEETFKDPIGSDFVASDRQFYKDGEIDVPAALLGTADQVGILVGLAAGNYYAGLKTANALNQSKNIAVSKELAMKTNQSISTIGGGYFASLASNRKEAKEMGLKGLEAANYSNTMSLIEGLSELVMPNNKLFSPELKALSLDTYVKALAKGSTSKLAMKEALQVVSENIGKENFEEILVMAGKTVQTAAISIDNENIDVYIPTIEEVINTIATTSIASGIPSIISQRNVSKNVKNQALIKASENINQTKDVLQGYVSKGIVSGKEANSLLEKLGAVNQSVKEIPNNLPLEKQGEILEIAEQLTNLRTQLENKKGVAKKIIQDEINTLEDKIFKLTEEVAVEDVATPDSFIFSEEEYKEEQRFINDAKTKKISIEEVVNNDPTATELDKKLISALSPFLKGKNVYYQDGFNYNISNELVDDLGGYGATISENGDILVFYENNLNTEVILHEGLHSLLFTKINETTRNEKDQVFVDEIQRIFDFVKNDSDLVSRYDYAFNNLDEFVSEAFGNRNFRQELSYISDETSGVKSNVFKSFIDSIRKFLKLEYNFEIDNSALESILNAVDYTLQDKRDTTQETLGLIEEQEYTKFVDEGVVSEERIQDIADKVRQQQELTPREQEIFTDKTSEVNQKIAEFAPTEEVSETVETISPLPERLKNVRVARVGDTFDKGKRGEAINEKEIEEAQSVLMDELNEIENSNLPQEQKDAASAEVEKLFNELENYELTTETKTRKITQKRPTRVVREGVKEQTKSPQERTINRAVRMPEEEGVGVSEEINTQIQSIRDKIEREKQRRSETRERRKKKGIAKEPAGRIFTNSFKKQEELEQELERLIKKEKQRRVEDKTKKKEQVTVVLEEQDGKIVLQAFDKDGIRTTAKELELESVNDLELVEALKDDDGKVIGATVRNKNNDAEVFSIMDEELALDYAIEKTKAEVGEMSIEEESVFEEYEEVKKRPTKKKPTKEVVKEEVTEKVEPTKPITEETLTEEETSALDDILGFSGQKKRVYTDSKSESDKRRLKRVNNALDKIEDSFQKIFPNLYIGIAEDSDMFAKFAKEQGTSKESRSRGVFTSINVEGEPKRYGIILNPDFANVTTAFHEAFHALMKVNGFNNEQARAVTSRMIKSVQKGATPELNENLERFVSQYETPEQSEEYMSELFGILSYNYSKQSGTVKGVIKRWLRKLAEILGLKPKNTLLSSVGLSDSDAATVNMLNVLADKMSRGKVLSKEDVTALRMGGPLTAQQVAADMRMDEEHGDLVEDAEGDIPSNIEDDGPSIDLIRKSKQQINRGGIDISSIKRGSINELSGANAFVFAADQATYGKIKSPSGLEYDFFGGYLYPYGSGLGWAFTEEKAGNNVLKKVRESDGVGLVMSQAPDGITGSYSFYEYLNAEINNAIEKGASPSELLKYVNEKLKITKVAKTLASKGLPTQIKSLDELPSLMPFEGKNKVSYEVRGAFGKSFFSAKSQEMFGIPPLTKTAKVDVGVLDYVNDPSLKNVEYGDVVSAIQFDKDSKVERLEKSNPSYHPSYPFVITGKPIMVFNNSVDVRKVFPNAKPKSEKASQVPLGKREKPQAARSAMGGQYVAKVPSKVKVGDAKIGITPETESIKKSKRQPEKNKKLKEAIEFAKDNNLSPKKLNNYLLSKGYTQEEIDEATPVKSKPKESIKKLINKVSRLTDNNEARAIVAKELRELLKDSKLSQFSKRTINKVITSLKNTNVSNMQKMLDKVDDAISNDEGRAERIKRYKNRSIAIKRIAKIGPLKELQDPFIRMMGIDPKYLSKETQKEYDSVLSDILNINKKYDKTSRDAFKAKIDLVLDSYDIDSVRAKEIADRINELIDPNKTLNTNLARLEKDKKITKEERELITRFKSLLDESSIADPMAGYTEEEIEEYKGMLEAEKREGIEEDFIETLSQPQSAFYSADDTGAFKLSEEERSYVKEANSITLKDIQELSLRDAKSVVRALEAMKAGFLTPELFQGVIKVRGVRGNMSIPLNEIKESGVVDKISSKISSSILNIGRKKKITGIGDRLRSAPTKNYEQVLKTEKELLSDGSKRFKGTNIYKSLFKPTSTAFSKSEQILNRIEDKLKNATALLSRNQNERFIQKAKIMVFQIQREYDSNVGNKEVNQAKDWINATIKDKDTALDERDIRELEKIRDRYLTDGQVDAKKLYDSLTANEKKALEIIDGVYDELTFMARMDAAVQGMPFIHRENYIHLPKSGTKTSEISNDFEPLFDSFMNASVKNKAAIQRTGKTHSISFDPVSNAYSASRKIVVGYHMYPVIKSTRIAFSGLKNRAETRFEKDLVNELESIYDRIINSQYKNVTKNKVIADNIFRYLTKAGYFSQLSGVVKAASELGSNTLHAVMNHAGSFIDGYATLVSVDTKTIDKALENTDTTQMDRLTKTAKFDNKDIEGKLLSKAKLFNPEQMTGELAASAKTVGKVAAMPFQAVFKLNESLITKPDEMVIRPLFVGEFQNKFKQLTGQKLNWEKLANDESYRDRFQEAINQASEQADSAVIDTSASTNPFDTIPSNISDPDASDRKKAMQVINRYMTNFRVFEYYSAVKGVQNLFGKGEISRGAGFMLLASTIMRMSIYRLGIDYAFGLIFSMLGMDEDEDEIKEEDLTRSALSGIVTLAFGRNLGNITQSAINLGIEFANMEFGEGITWDSVTKDGEKTEYDSYKDYMVFSKIPVKRSPGRDLFVDFLISSAGPLTPTIKSVRRATTLTDRSIYNKTKESRDKNKNELFFKTPFDIAGSLGFIPNYKELKKINDRYWFGGNRDTEKKTTEKKTKGKILGRTRTQSSRSFSTGRKAPRSNRTR